jgi:hypothetical protein
MRETKTNAPQVPQQTRGQDEVSGVAEPRHSVDALAPQRTAWVGWIVFASMMMLMVGTFQLIAGFTALFKDDYYAVGSGNLLVNVDYTAWGWTHIGIGALVLAASAGLLSAYPLWSLIVITLDVFVIYAIAVHGSEVKADS